MRAAGSLPSLSAIDMAASVLQAIGAEDATERQAVAPLPERRKVRRGPRRRPVGTWLLGGTAAAAAAAVVALLVLVIGRSSGPTGGAATAGRAAPSVVARGRSYTSADLDALVGRLAAGTSDRAAASLPSGSQNPQATLAPAAPGQAASSAPTSCLARGGAPNGSPVYLEAATVNGQGAYVGAYIESGSNGERILALLAVSRSTCVPLYFVTHRI